MSAKVSRNAVVARLGTPNRTEGSLNDPREKEEHGFIFNEKWIYEHLPRDPAGVPIRTIYWWRYDFTGTVVRATDAEPWRADTTLVDALAGAVSRMDVDKLAPHPAITPATEYHPASEFKGTPDLGGHREDDPKLI